MEHPSRMTSIYVAGFAKWGGDLLEYGENWVEYG